MILASLLGLLDVVIADSGQIPLLFLVKMTTSSSDNEHAMPRKGTVMPIALLLAAIDNASNMPSCAVRQILVPGFESC
jgi:hypothetical protein